MNKDKEKVALTYIGRTGSDFAFKLAGVKSEATDNSSELVDKVKKIAEKPGNKIIFVDEGVASEVQEELQNLTADASCSLVLLPDPNNSQRLAAKQMDRLMIQAVGSDIFNK